MTWVVCPKSAIFPRTPLFLNSVVSAEAESAKEQPLDSRRRLPVPDAMNQLKSTLNDPPAQELTLIVAREQEALNLQKIATYRGFGERHEQKGDHYEMVVTLDGSTPKGSSLSCGG